MGTILTLLFVGLLAIIAVGLVLSALGAAFSLALGVAGFLLFKVAPIVLVGWLILKLVDRKKSRDRISAADRAWLES